MATHDAPPTSVLLMTGTPDEIGGNVWARIVAPGLAAMAGQPAEHLMQFYSGLLMGCMGSMAADLGQAQAAALVRTLVASFEGMQLPNGAQH